MVAQMNGQQRLPPELVGDMMNHLAPLTTAAPARRQQGNDARSTIAALRGQGLSSRQIATALNLAGVPTATGRGRWWPQTVDRHENPGAWAAYIRQYRYHHPNAR